MNTYNDHLSSEQLRAKNNGQKIAPEFSLRARQWFLFDKTRDDQSAYAYTADEPHRYMNRVCIGSNYLRTHIGFKFTDIGE
jgi:hypothetical protein